MSYLLHFDLVEDLRHRGCPMCRAAGRAGREYVRSLMTTDITDATVCADLRRAGGLCRHHVLLAVEVARGQGDAMGLALLEELLLDVARRGLATERRRRVLPRRRPLRCPGCAAETVVVDGYADLLLSDQNGYQTALFAAGDAGLCSPHVAWVLRRPGDPAAHAAVRTAWLAKAERYGREVAESVSSHRADRQHPASISSQTAIWTSIPVWLTGSPSGSDHGQRSR